MCCVCLIRHSMLRIYAREKKRRGERREERRKESGEDKSSAHPNTHDSHTHSVILHILDEVLELLLHVHTHGQPYKVLAANLRGEERRDQKRVMHFLERRAREKGERETR